MTENGVPFMVKCFSPYICVCMCTVHGSVLIEHSICSQYLVHSGGAAHI